MCGGFAGGRAAAQVAAAFAERRSWSGVHGAAADKRAGGIDAPIGECMKKRKLPFRGLPLFVALRCGAACRAVTSARAAAAAVRGSWW